MIQRRGNSLPLGWFGKAWCKRRVWNEAVKDEWGFEMQLWERLFNTEMLWKTATMRTTQTLDMVRLGFLAWRVEESFSLLTHSFVHSSLTSSFIRPISVEPSSFWVLHWIRPDHRQRKSQLLWSLLLEVSSLVGKKDFIQYFMLLVVQSQAGARAME